MEGTTGFPAWKFDASPRAPVFHKLRRFFKVCPMKHLHLHMVSDSAARPSPWSHGLVSLSLEGWWPVFWNMVRHKRNWTKLSRSWIASEVLFFIPLSIKTFVEPWRKPAIECEYRVFRFWIFVISVMRRYLHSDIQARPGSRHMLDEAYFDRIEAINFVLGHDDGQSVSTISSADVVVVGVSRTSKTPTCFYLANKGVLEAANVPLVPETPLPKELLKPNKPFVISLTMDPKPLVEIRRNPHSHVGSIGGYAIHRSGSGCRGGEYGEEALYRERLAGN